MSDKQSGLVVCFTGPRPHALYEYDANAYVTLKEYLRLFMSELYKKNTRTFISGGAQGFDQLAFEAVSKLKYEHPEISNQLYLPFKGQERLWSTIGIFSQTEYCGLLTKADEVRYIGERSGAGGKEEIISLLHGRNHAMVADADYVVALLAGRSVNWRDSRGGTSECVRYAIRCKKPVLAIEYDLHGEDPFNSPIYWITM